VNTDATPPAATVLYIEDSPDNVHLVQRLLARRPRARLEVARTARDGLAAAAERPALILLDNRLPDATGRDVLRQLAASEATAGIPVIIISGDSGQATADELIASGAAEFLPKPFNIHQFLAAIDRYLG
jgi:CheY-like chemotaxis protein